MIEPIVPSMEAYDRCGLPCIVLSDNVTQPKGAGLTARGSQWLLTSAVWEQGWNGMVRLNELSVEVSSVRKS